MAYNKKYKTKDFAWSLVEDWMLHTDHLPEGERKDLDRMSKSFSDIINASNITSEQVEQIANLIQNAYLYGRNK